MSHTNYIISTTFFLVALVLFTARNPLANSHGVGTSPRLNFSGRLCCTPTGTCPGNPLVGAVVNLTCTNLTGVSTTLGHTITGANGSFNVTLNETKGINLNTTILPCVATVALPLKPELQCPLHSTTTGAIRFLLKRVGMLVLDLVCVVITVRLG